MRRGTGVLLVGALLLGACSGEDDSETAAADTAASSETTTTTAIAFVEVDPASVPADPSAGCGGAATTPPGETGLGITSGDIDGSYAQYVPTAQDGDTPVPLVLDRLDYGCAVELYRVVGGGHTWPGSRFDVAIEGIVGPVTMSIDANELMWAFFQDHPLQT